MAEKKRRKTKIVCTIGPASESPQILKVLIQAGMNVARLNFSHGTHEEHLRKIKTIRQISDRLKQPVAILQDLGGPKIRIGMMKEGGVELKRGKEFFLTSQVLIGDETQATVTYSALPGEVKLGDRILLADGTIELQVLESNGKNIRCQVIVGGILTSHKGMNFPTGTLQVTTFTEKDHEDLLFGIQHGVDLVGLSYIQRADDIEGVKRILKKESADIPVIAKIERKEALEKIDEIILASDGIMVARGDLGLETPIEKIPNVQKKLIQKANALGKPVITATQMLRSMVDHTQPTRAEVTDVVNAIYDGTDAVMLSEETAIGQFPVEAFQMMAKIAQSAEEEFPHPLFLRRETDKEMNLQQAISKAASLLSEEVGAKAIVTPTESGSTARWVSRFRPKQPILALSRHLSTVRRLNLCWGVYPVLVSDWKDTDEMLERSKRMPKELGMTSEGEKIVIIAGVPISIPGTTNLIKVEVVE
ncbi:MAG: pyruvate kinase [Deltaproteobacteria bacterium CG03_land_8_20_14_0_80_45_14]|nr:MAG: pyruvate kinase [Deltaproteobacteria bacterium CG03_land_8_20_14_0_80_45_14]